MERHRFLAALLAGLRDRIDGRTVLDIAPSPTVNLVLGRMAPARHLRVDFDPAADGRPVDVQASLTALPLPDRSVDTMLCYHVLEHIPDDAIAMREIARVLRTDGLAFLQVPFRAGAATDEDPGAGEAERIRRFGQADHVRYYGEDFETRLAGAGLGFLRIDPADVLGEAVGHAMNVGRKEFVWLAWPAMGDGPRVDLPELSNRVLSQLVLLWGTQAAEQSAELGRLRTRVTRLRHRLHASERKRATARQAAPTPARTLASRLVRRLRQQAATVRRNSAWRSG